MSLTYRSPLEENLGAYDSTVQAAIASTSANYYRETEASNFQFFNYYLRPEAKKNLIDAGIYLSPFSAVPHSHAACKTLENHLLYNVLPSLIDNRFYFVGIKNCKLDLLKSRNTKLSTVAQINRYVTSADKARYGPDLVRVSSDPNVKIARHKFEVDGPTLRELIPRLQLVNHDYLFLHDELHYWSPKSLVTFLEIMKPAVMYATLVYPPELLAGSKVSLNRWCYTFKILGNDLLFYPDGVVCEGYQQPLRNGYLLKANRIELNNGDIYMVDVVHSKFAHHLISITRGELASPSVRSFGPFDATSTHGLEPLLRNVQHCFPVPYSVVSRIYRYLSTLKKPDVQSAMAKLSQLLEEPSGMEMKFLKDFASLVIGTNSICTLIKPERIKVFLGHWLKALPNPIAARLKIVQSVSLDDFIMMLAPFTFEVRLGTIRYNHHEIFNLYDMAECEGEIDLPALLDDRFTMGAPALIADRIPQLVSADFFNVYRKTSTLLKIPRSAFEKFVIRRVYNSLQPLTRSISTIDVMAELTSLLELRGLIILPSQQMIKILRKGDFLQCCIRKACSRFTRFLLPTWFEDPCFWFLQASRYNAQYLDQFPHGVAVYSAIKNPFATVVRDMSMFRPSTLRRRCPPPRYLRQVVVPPLCSLCDGRIPTDCAHCHEGVKDDCHQSDDPQVHPTESTPEAEDSRFGKSDEWGPSAQTASDAHTEEGVNGEAETKNTGEAHDEEPPPPPASNEEVDGASVIDEDEEQLPRTNPVREIGLFTCRCKLTIPVTTMPLPTNHNFSVKERLGNRSAGWYTRYGNVPYAYNGGAHADLGWPTWLDDWMFCNGIRTDYYDCVLYQIYDKHGRIGLHSDNEKIFEKGSSVHTCNLEGSAEFTIKCAEGSDRLLLKPGTQFTMPEGMQISHRHAVNDASSNRSSLTFRRLNLKYAAESAGGQESDERQAGAGSGNDDRQSNAGRTKPDVPSVDLARQSGNEEEGPSGSTADEEQPQREHHNNPGGFKIAGGLLRINDVSDVVRQMNYHCYEVPGDGNCFWYSMEKALGFKALDLKGKCGHYTFTDDPKAQQRLQLQMVEYAMAEDEAIMAAANVTRHTLQVLCPDEGLCYTYIPHTESKGSVYLRLQHQHFERIEPRNRCLIIAVAAALGREEASIMSVLEEKEVCTFHTSIWQGTGVAIEDLEFYFSLFDIQATVFSGERAVKYNGNGRIPASFNLVDGHITFCKKNNPVAVEIMRGEAVPLSVSEKSLLELTSFCTELTYHADPARAKVLADSLESGCTGIALSKLFNNARNMMSGVTETTAERIVHCLLGTFGSGKSTYFTKFTKQNPGKGVFYVSPRKALAIEHENKCLGRNNSKRKDGKVPARRGPDSINWHTLTFENFLKKIHLVKPGMALIVDEIQLYPPGYLDLVCFLLAPGVHTFVGGDPCQSDYDNEKDRAWLGSMVSDICRLLDGQVYKFNVQSQRFVNQNFSGRLPCIIDRSGKCGTGEAIDEPHLLYTGCDELVQLEEEFKEVFLVSSFEEKKIVETHFPEIPGGRVMTFGESTGLNFKNGTILITNVSSFTNEKRWVTALSRFRLNICLVNLVGVDWNSLAATYRNRVLGRFLSAQASKLDLCDLLPGKPEFTEGFTSYVGKDEGVREDKLVGDPWLKCMIDLGQTEDVEVAEIAEEVMQEEWFKTHLPQAELESVRARWVHKILAKERREVRMGSMVSDQFTDEYAKEGGAILTNAAERFETIYPRHRANDTVTFIMAVKKRLRFSRPAVERAKLIEADLYGEFLLKEFLKRVPLNGKHDPHMMQKAKQAFEEKKVSKSAAIIENHAGRSCRDWLLDIGQIFSKSQLCTKFDNRFRVAKAAQSIVCFQHAVLCRFAPYMRYIEMKVNEVLPKNYYIHSGKGLDELQEWVIKGKFSGVCTESDYEAFDASQDQYIVAFEVAVMKLLGLPRDLIEDYKFIKTHLGSKLGNFAIMRFSGEASTFLFNTMANMLFTFLRYDLKGREYICFAGDDMCASERLPLRKEHEGFLKKLKLKAKVFMVEKPTFCGWHLCPDGIYKKPQLVLERMLIAKEKNNLANCLDNYAIEVAYAYKLGERAVNRMDAEELEAAHNCVRIIIKNKKLLKSDILGFYSDLEAKMKC